MIHKQVLKIEDIQTIQVPKDSQLLSVQEQRGALTVWYFFQCATEFKYWTFEIIGTGNYGPKADDSFFVSTVQMSSGLVWHVWAHYDYEMEG